MINEALFIEILIIIFYLGIFIYSMKVITTEDRGALFSIIIILVLVISALATRTVAFQMVEFVGILILILYLVLNTIYPALYSEQEEVLYIPRRKTIWEIMEEEKEKAEGEA
ncbi:MAG: hypothetical protein ACTSU2_16320 [Promethearchaeota archaeon]